VQKRDVATTRECAPVTPGHWSLQGGNVWEKAGVNVSVVYGSMPPEAYRAATGANAASTGKVGTPLNL
jgi:coproporphyrinogen III oxidase